LFFLDEAGTIWQLCSLQTETKISYTHRLPL
jgi:hypothetical protein